MLREAVRIDPADVEGRSILARAALAQGDVETARGYLDRKTAPARIRRFCSPWPTSSCAAGHLDQVSEILPALVSLGRDSRQKVVALAWSHRRLPARGGVYLRRCRRSTRRPRRVNSRSGAQSCRSSWRDARQTFPALMKLVEVCVDGGLGSPDVRGPDAVGRRLPASGQAAEARVDRRRSRRSRTVGARAHRPVPAGARHVAGLGSRYASSPSG